MNVSKLIFLIDWQKSIVMQVAEKEYLQESWDRKISSGDKITINIGNIHENN